MRMLSEHLLWARHCAGDAMGTQAGLAFKECTELKQSTDKCGPMTQKRNLNL